MQNPVFFKSKSGNQYFFDSYINRMHYCSNGLREVIEKYNNSLLSDIEVETNASDSNIGFFKILKSNGYFIKQRRVNNDIIINEKNVQYALENINQITFETTERCNLKCKYCSYSDLYNDHYIRKNKDMSFEMAKTLIDYFNQSSNSPKDKSYNRLLYISFYGGEPLINFDFIQEVVKYIGSLNIKRKIQFSITTNALLIEKHIDFLVENQFNTLISIDGNELHNSYRLLPDGKSSFNILYNNMLNVKNKYPSYFEERVNLNTVIHNKNNVSEVHNFLLSQFGKTTNMTEIRNTGVNPKQKNVFEKIFQSVNKSIDISSEKGKIINDSFIKLSTVKNLSLFIHKFGGYNYTDYSSIENKKTPIHKTPSGTCIPFNKRIFITANGLLLPCENVDHKYHLGKINSGKVELDFRKIVQFYQKAFLKLPKFK